jgi:hypothetical protein
MVEQPASRRWWRARQMSNAEPSAAST